MSPQEKLLFEQEDLEIFKIPDFKTRLNTIQNYFFPRLEILLKQSLELIQEIYKFNPYERITFLYTPSHRKDAKNNKQDRHFVRIGVGGKRRNDRDLRVKRQDGKPYKLHNSQLYYLIEPSGEIRVCLWLLGGLEVTHNLKFIRDWRDLLEENSKTLNKVFTLNHISHSTATNFTDFSEISSEQFTQYLTSDSLWFFSPTYYLPIRFERGLFELQMVFAALYPLLDASIDLEENQSPRLSEMLSDYVKWYQKGGSAKWYRRHAEFETGKTNQEIELPELDNYRFIRAGLWWEILARDNWTCCSCGRSVREHGITLHVDHILPRSRGGTNDQGNLQALCMKCNLGKSNRDDTDLTQRV